MQGVGFRPFVYRLAKQKGITGVVLNNQDGVLIRANGSRRQIEDFIASLARQRPAAAAITALRRRHIPYRPFAGFSIQRSERNHALTLPLTPDLSICARCIADVDDAANRRFRYPFTTCVSCGPRFAVTDQYPFEREHTAFARFSMCAACKAEYEDPKNRRFHSQTNTCGVCGPTVQLIDTETDRPTLRQEKALDGAAHRLLEGALGAIKNTAGYLLCCLASDTGALRRLRRFKRRPHKPFALLYPDMEQVSRDFVVDEVAAQALQSQERPILILSRKRHAPIHPLVAPGLRKMGVMLPNSPLLHLLARKVKQPLIATSGNTRGRPIACEEKSAEGALRHGVDFFLHHDVSIRFPQDDSVMHIVGGRPLLLRRARGWAPYAPPLPRNALKDTSKATLAMGADRKSTFALVSNGMPYLSPYFGDLSDMDVWERYQTVLYALLSMFQCRPHVVVMDMHPLYESRKWGLSLAHKWSAQCVYVQHHKAHFAAVLSEHNLWHTDTPVLGVVWDGMGWGEDKCLWGGEFFTYENRLMKRIHHLRYFDWIASDKMAQEPRIALLALCGETHKPLVKSKFTPTEWRVYNRLLERNTLKTSSVGRLIDAVACLLAQIDKTTYEGQAAMLLEACAARCEDEDGLCFLPSKDPAAFDPYAMMDGVFSAWQSGKPIPWIARSFLYTLADYIVGVAQRHAIRAIACSGGVFQNAILTDRVVKEGKKNKITVYCSNATACNDEHISYGQLGYYYAIN